MQICCIWFRKKDIRGGCSTVQRLKIEFISEDKINHLSYECDWLDFKKENRASELEQFY